ncbi:DUF3800 domain-containing protein [Celeribacter sp.]|uniref:DUF3800 domain-containing protein n=1 Tax=Celeribacter sp. TaxID=1890673 RepID=UPI003A938082
MYLMYVDESGDAGNNTAQTRYFCLSGIVVHESEWRGFVDRIIQFRKTLRGAYGFPMRAEVHSVEMLRKNPFGIEKHIRLAILRNYLDELAKLNSISITNVVVDKMGKPSSYDVFSSAWRTLFQRFENTLVHGNFPGGYRRSFGTVYTDATAGKKLTGIMRKMSVHNPIPNRWGGGFTNHPIHKIIEDPAEKDSASSLPIQSCDVVAYFLQQKLAPNSYIRRKRAVNYFDRLDGVLNKKASREHPQGIVFL